MHWCQLDGVGSWSFFGSFFGGVDELSPSLSLSSYVSANSPTEMLLVVPPLVGVMKFAIGLES